MVQASLSSIYRRISPTARSRFQQLDSQYDDAINNLYRSFGITMSDADHIAIKEAADVLSDKYEQFIKVLFSIVRRQAALSTFNVPFIQSVEEFNQALSNFNQVRSRFMTI